MAMPLAPDDPRSGIRRGRGMDHGQIGGPSLESIEEYYSQQHLPQKKNQDITDSLERSSRHSATPEHPH
jgi:hypothetical protein